MYERNSDGRWHDVPSGVAVRPNHCCSMDFVSDELADRRSFRILTVVDQFTRECIQLEADSRRWKMPGRSWRNSAGITISSARIVLWRIGHPQCPRLCTKRRLVH